MSVGNEAKTSFHRHNLLSESAPNRILWCFFSPIFLFLSHFSALLQLCILC
jgi:hypothetical protein